MIRSFRKTGHDHIVDLTQASSPRTPDSGTVSSGICRTCRWASYHVITRSSQSRCIRAIHRSSIDMGRVQAVGLSNGKIKASFGINFSSTLYVNDHHGVFLKVCKSTNAFQHSSASFAHCASDQRIMIRSKRHLALCLYISKRKRGLHCLLHCLYKRRLKTGEPPHFCHVVTWLPTLGPSICGIFAEPLA